METKTNPVPMPRPSGLPLADLRARVLADHARLRLVITDVDRLASAVAAGEVSWGPIRVEQLQHDHEGQRVALKQAAHDLAIEGRPLGQTVQSMCWEILHDMKREEHDLLHPDLWLDVAITG